MIEERTKKKKVKLLEAGKSLVVTEKDSLVISNNYYNLPCCFRLDSLSLIAGLLLVVGAPC